MTSTALAKQQAHAEQTVQSLVRGNWAAISQSLPATMDPKRFARLIFNSVRRTPKLAQCSATSLIGSLLSSSALGLEVDTPLGESYLVPYGQDAQLIVGYQGIVKLYRQHPMAGQVGSGWVGQRDRFDYAYGTSPFLTHVPARGDRGEPIAFWASYTLKDGTTDFVVLSPEEVATLRGKTRKGDIADPQHWMSRKTALKQVLKLAPKSTMLAAALMVDEQPVGGAHQVTGLESVAASVAAIAHEAIDPATGEVLDEVPDSREAQPAVEPAPDAPSVGEGKAGAEGGGAASSQAAAPPLTQRKAVQAAVMHFDRLGVSDRAERLMWTALIAGREIASTNDLALAELRDVVTRLERAKDRAALEALGAVLEAEREGQGDE